LRYLSNCRVLTFQPAGICACEQGRACGDDAERHARLRSPTQEVARDKYPTTWIGWCCCSVHTPYTQYHSPSRTAIRSLPQRSRRWMSRCRLPLCRAELNVQGPWKPKKLAGIARIYRIGNCLHTFLYMRTRQQAAGSAGWNTRSLKACPMCRISVCTQRLVSPFINRCGPQHDGTPREMDTLPISFPASPDFSPIPSQMSVHSMGCSRYQPIQHWRWDAIMSYSTRPMSQWASDWDSHVSGMSPALKPGTTLQPTALHAQQAGLAR
jgi:hypothetical protein